ncbi:tRNA (adenosine(37)-N6)-threonylcarbamoyltransferase complex dimerization subunit type 1 TsaB [Pelagibacteraceae bacterium]|nr:tRNA (adenosine(37)-N6)-threonylcarbamoyltransferase complex dimerization subunit type 1 TsaB [Pelagibacteraceae bacterium]
MFLFLDFTTDMSLTLIGKHFFLNKEIKSNKNISEILVIEIEKIFNKAKINIKKLDTIFVITGPGSFTGIRSALTFAKTIQLTNNTDVRGISKFEFLNLIANDKNLFNLRTILIFHRKMQFFSQNFKGNLAISKPEIINFEENKKIFNKRTSIICDNNVLVNFVDKKYFELINQNMYFVDYNNKKLKILINKKNKLTNDPRPVYISSNY